MVRCLHSLPGFFDFSQKLNLKISEDFPLFRDQPAECSHLETTSSAYQVHVSKDFTLFLRWISKLGHITRISMFLNFVIPAKNRKKSENRSSPISRNQYPDSRFGVPCFPNGAPGIPNVYPVSRMVYENGDPCFPNGGQLFYLTRQRLLVKILLVNQFLGGFLAISRLKFNIL